MKRLISFVKTKLKNDFKAWVIIFDRASDLESFKAHFMVKVKASVCSVVSQIIESVFNFRGGNSAP